MSTDARRVLLIKLIVLACCSPVVAQSSRNKENVGPLLLEDANSVAYPHTLNLTQILDATKTLRPKLFDVIMDGGSLSYAFTTDTGRILWIMLPHPGIIRDKNRNDAVVVMYDPATHEYAEIIHKSAEEAGLIALLNGCQLPSTDVKHPICVYVGADVALELLKSTIKTRVRLPTFDYKAFETASETIEFQKLKSAKSTDEKAKP